MTKPRRLAVGAFLIPALLVSAAACGGDETDASPGTATPSASKDPASSAPSLAEPEKGGEAEAMAAYRAHWQEVEKAYAKNSIEGTDIKKTSVGPARLAIEKSVKSARENGQAVKGSPGLSNLTVTKADLNRDVPKVHLSSCLDVSKWVIYNKSTGEPVPQPSDRLTKYTVTSLLEKWPDGWVVTKDEPHQDTQC
ncbi:hypothetical protein ACF067_28245 [Streptomyces albidoflavus]